MSLFSNPFDANSRLACGCGRHASQAEHERATQAIAQGDAAGSAALDPDGVLNRAIRDVKAEVGVGLVVMSDLCLDEFTDHGHCGVLTAEGAVDND
ncbi:hypothetical protein LLE87_28015, partial [Paenibacillus polymyxa]|nr:hypothetical protein [Paenibacillus polymyxa]